MLDSNLPLIKWVTAVEIDANKNFIRIVGFIINHKLCTMTVNDVENNIGYGGDLDH